VKQKPLIQSGPWTRNEIEVLIFLLLVCVVCFLIAMAVSQ